MPAVLALPLADERSRSGARGVPVRGDAEVAATGVVGQRAVLGARLVARRVAATRVRGGDHAGHERDRGDRGDREALHAITQLTRRPVSTDCSSNCWRCSGVSVASPARLRRAASARARACSRTCSSTGRSGRGPCIRARVVEPDPRVLARRASAARAGPEAPARDRGRCRPALSVRAVRAGPWRAVPRACGRGRRRCLP